MEKPNKIVVAQTKSVCGIIMPISPIDGCTTEHWQQVQDILREIIDESGLEANLVSDSEDVGVIQGRIVQNIYNYPIVICDVSGKNPNVMFELGLRLAFDKATIIIKDDKTDYSFDTSPIEHIAYPRDLHYVKIVSFKEKLKVKLLATLKKSIEDPGYSPFLKHFGEFIVPKLEQKEVGFNDFVIQALNQIQDELSLLKKPTSTRAKRAIKKEESFRMDSVEEREEFMRGYIKDLYDGGKYKTLEDIKETSDEYIEAWENLGYSKDEYEMMFKKLGIELKIPTKK